MNSITINNLRNAEYLQFIKDYIAIIDLNNPATLQIDAKLANLRTKSTELENLFKKILANPISQELVALDNRRDNALNGIYYHCLRQSRARYTSL